MKNKLLVNLICAAVTILAVQGLASAWGGIPVRKSNVAGRQALQQEIAKETGTEPEYREVHAVSIGSASKSFRKVMVWQGSERGPGDLKHANVTYGVRLALVPKNRDLTPAERAKGTILSADLTAKGAARVKAHLIAQGLKPTSIELGDFVKPMKTSNDPSDIRLSQKPVTRQSGNIRYTVKFADGTDRRYLVETHGKELLKGKIELGKVFADKDVYR